MDIIDNLTGEFVPNHMDVSSWQVLAAMVALAISVVAAVTAHRLRRHTANRRRWAIGIAYALIPVQVTTFLALLSPRLEPETPTSWPSLLVPTVVSSCVIACLVILHKRSNWDLS